MARPAEFTRHPYDYSKRPPNYRAVTKNVIDGDTFDCFIDLGLRKYAFETIRVRDFDAPEISHPRNDAERAHGYAARSYLYDLIMAAPIYLTTYPDTETYGRFVADVFYWHQETRAWRSVAVAMRDAGFEKRESY